MESTPRGYLVARAGNPELQMSVPVLGAARRATTEDSLSAIQTNTVPIISLFVNAAVVVNWSPVRASPAAGQAGPLRKSARHVFLVLVSVCHRAPHQHMTHLSVVLVKPHGSQWGVSGDVAATRESTRGKCAIQLQALRGVPQVRFAAVIVGAACDVEMG